jgi:indolepyruvate ferredoxin oxidoreductase alpha subunit
LLSGAEALVRALAAAHIARAWSFPGAPLTQLELVLDAGGCGVEHRFVANEQLAASMALGGALLSGQGTCSLMSHVGVSNAVDALASFGVINELRSPALLIEGVDPRPTSARLAQDNRALLSSTAHLAQLEAGAPDEAYQLTRLAARASRGTGIPIAIRVGQRALDGKIELREGQADGLPTDGGLFARAAGPFVSTAATYRFHAEKRARRLHQLQPLVDALAVKTVAGVSNPGVILAGMLGPTAHALAWARRLSTLRLGAAWPLPRKTLIEFMKGREGVLVLEEGEPFLERELQAFAHREGLACRVRGAGESRPQRLDDERLDTLLQRYGGRVRAAVDPVVRTAEEWKAASAAVAAIGDDDGEPWPLYFARTRASMKGFAATDPRLALLGGLRNLDRPTIIVSEPGLAGVLGARDRLIDLKLHMGSAAPAAGALAAVAEVEEQSGSPLVVALIPDSSLYHSAQLGVLDNLITGRDVLHVIVVNRRTAATPTPKIPQLTDDALESSLRSVGMQVTTASLDDAHLQAALLTAASQSGPRALICYGVGLDGEVDG